MAKKKNKNLITGIIAAVVAVALIAIVVVVVMTSGSKLNDSFFVSDGTKYVLALDANSGMIEVGNNEYAPEKAYLVYFYSENDVTDLKVYYKYSSNEAAKEAKEYIQEQEANDDEIAKIEIDGEYVVITASKDTYDEMTADDARQQVEFMEMLQNMDFDDTTDYGADVEGEGE